MKEYTFKETIIGGVGVKERQAASSETKRALGQKWQLARGGDQLVLRAAHHHHHYHLHFDQHHHYDHLLVLTIIICLPEMAIS